MRDYYKAADRFVGAFVDQLNDGETVFAVVSDQGMVADVKAVSLINFFAKRGWVTLNPDGSDVDWNNSLVFFVQNHLWINTKGRDSAQLCFYGRGRVNSCQDLTYPNIRMHHDTNIPDS